MLSLILLIAVVGFVVWIITTYLPMDPKFKQLIVVVAVVCTVLLVLRAFGVLSVLDRSFPKF